MSFYGAKVPMLGRDSWDEVRSVGDDWALVGDAAGFVDPITGEGIYFAIRSGELLAEAIVAGDLASYDRAWREDFGEDLAVASHYLDRFYRGGFLGASVVDRALLFARGHAGFRSVLRRALVGEQSYLTLKRDLALNALRVV
jgi:flavin-dependent dehydrogenase